MTVEDMEETLARLGIEVISTNGSEIQGHCPAHVARTGHEDRNPSWWINAETGAHICFSCQFKGGLFSLVSFVQGIEYEEAQQWVDSGDRNLSAALLRATKPKEVFQEVTYITESMLAAFTEPPTEALLSRGLSSNAARYYEVLWDNNHSNWITVIRDPITNKLLGWQEKGHKSRFFKNYPTGVQKSSALFGYQQFDGTELIVVESPLDVVRLASVGVLNGVSTYGAMVSDKQFHLIRSAKKIVFAMDNDDAGRASSLHLLEMCWELQTEAWFFNYDHTTMKDVGAMSKDEILLGIKNARHSVHGTKAVIS
jgi:DNA primase